MSIPSSSSASRQPSLPGREAQTQAQTRSDARHASTAFTTRAQAVAMEDDDRPIATRVHERRVEKRKAERSGSSSEPESMQGSDDERVDSKGETVERKSAKKPKAQPPSAPGRTGAARRPRGPAIGLASALDKLLRTCLPPASGAGFVRAQPDTGPMRKAMHEFFCGQGNNIKASRVGRGLRELMPWMATLPPAQRGLVIQAFADAAKAGGALQRLLPSIASELIAASNPLGEACAPTVRALAGALGPEFIALAPDNAPDVVRDGSLLRRLLAGDGNLALWTGILQAVQDAQGPQGVDACLAQVMAGQPVMPIAFFGALATLKGGRDMPVQELLRITRRVMGEDTEDPHRPRPYAVREAWLQALGKDGLALAHAQALRSFWLEATTLKGLETRGVLITRALLGRKPTPAALAALLDQAHRALPQATSARRAGVLLAVAQSVLNGIFYWQEGEADPRPGLVRELVRMTAALLASDGMAQADTLLGTLAEGTRVTVADRQSTIDFHDTLLDEMIARGWWDDRPLASRLLAAAAPAVRPTREVEAEGMLTWRFRDLEAYFTCVLHRAGTLTADEAAFLASAGAAVTGTISTSPDALPTDGYTHPLAKAVGKAGSLAPDALAAVVRGLAQGLVGGSALPQQLAWTASALADTAGELPSEHARALGRGLAAGLIARNDGEADVEATALSLMDSNRLLVTPRYADFLRGFVQGLGTPSAHRRMAWRLARALASRQAQPQPRASVAGFQSALAQGLGAARWTQAQADAVARWDLPTPPRAVREGKGDVPDGVAGGLASPDTQSSSSGPAERDPAMPMATLLAQIHALPPLPDTLPPLPAIHPSHREAARLADAVAKESLRLGALAPSVATDLAHQMVEEAYAALAPFQRSDGLVFTHDELRDIHRAFESRYAPDLDAADWQHDATALGWRLGFPALQELQHHAVIAPRVDRLRELAAAPGVRDCPDPVLAGYLCALTSRQAATVQQAQVFMEHMRCALLSAVLTRVRAPATPAERQAVVDTAAQVLRWTCGSLRSIGRPSSILRSLVTVLSTLAPTPERTDMRRWLTRGQGGQLLLAACEPLGIARDDEALGSLLDALAVPDRFDTATLFAQAGALRPLLSNAPRPPADQLAWVMARLAVHGAEAPRHATALALGFCPHPGMVRTLLEHIRFYPLEQQVNLMRIRFDASVPAAMASLGEDIPRDIVAFTGLTDAEALSLAMAVTLAQRLETGGRLPPGFASRFAATPAAAGMPTPAPGRQTLCWHAVDMVSAPWKALTDPVLQDLGRHHLLNRLLSLPQLQNAIQQKAYWNALMLEPLPPASKLEAASSLARHVGRYLTPTDFRLARLYLSEEFMSIAYAEAPPAAADEAAQAEYTVRLVEAASHIAAVYDRLQDNPWIAFAWKPADNPARRLEEILQRRGDLESARELLDRELEAIARPHVHERLRASLAPVLNGLREPIVTALALLPTPIVAGSPPQIQATRQAEAQPLD